MLLSSAAILLTAAACQDAIKEVQVAQRARQAIERTNENGESYDPHMPHPMSHDNETDPPSSLKASTTQHPSQGAVTNSAIWF